MSRLRALPIAVAFAAALGGSGAAADAGHHGASAPPLPDLLFELPAAGSYDLPVIDRVEQRELLDPDGEAAPLWRQDPGACTVVSFVYLGCTDATGCPLALAQKQRLDRALATHPELAGRVRLATVSFDPENDTPRAMANLRHHMAPKGEWRFLTAPGEASLAPVLRDFGQDAVPVLTRGGKDAGLMQHVAKVFLLDASGRVRNVYSTGFFDHRVVLRDIETLLQNEGQPD